MHKNIVYRICLKFIICFKHCNDPFNSSFYSISYKTVNEYVIMECNISLYGDSPSKKMKILKLFTHFYAIPDVYDVLSWHKHKDF